MSLTLACGLCQAPQSYLHLRAMSKCEDYLTDIDTAYGEADYWWDRLDEVEDWLNDNYVTPPSELAWREKVWQGISHCETVLKNLIWGNWQGYKPYRVPYYLRYCIEAEPFDMDVLLSTMLAAEFEQFQTFIGIEDGYRMALWNKPFNAEYYAALARGFML